MKEITLYFTEGSSDKVYQVRLFSDADGYTVSYANAARGRALNHKPKNAQPLPLNEAETCFNKLIKSKARKGYTTSVCGTPFTGVDMDGSPCENTQTGTVNTEHSGITPQLLNEISRQDAERLCNDPRYCAQLKYDGERRLLERKRTGDVRGINKKGFYTTPTPSILASAKMIAADSHVIDGEDMGQSLYAFDLLELNGDNIGELPYRERYALLQSLAADLPDIHVVETAFTAEEKRDLMCRVNDKGLEGVVFKRLDETFNAGKGGEQYKFKFYDEASVIVESISATKRSVGMAVMDNGKMVSVGKVTIPQNKDIPVVGSIIDVKYLYAYKGGALFTTSYLKERGDDISPEECCISRLKFKAETQAA